MNAFRPHGRRAPVTAALAALALAASGLIAGSGAQAVAADSGPTKLYLVQAIGAPVATYDGKVTGFGATRTPQGKRLDAHSGGAKAYRSYLTGKHDAALKAAGISPAKKTYDYGVTFNAALETGGVLVSEKITLEFEVSAIKTA